MAVQKGDFIKLSYTGKLENGAVFDTTDANVAKEFGIYNEQASYGPETVVVGKGYVVAGLDEDLIGKDVGYKGTVTVPPEKGFGLRRIDQFETFSAKKFKEPVRPGMRVQINNRTGTVESMAGGRVRVNFNPMFAGETLNYEYTIESLIEDRDEKINSILKVLTGQVLEHSADDNKLTIHVPQEFGYNQRWLITKSIIASQIYDIGFNEVVYQETYKKQEPVEQTEEQPEEKKE